MKKILYSFIFYVSFVSQVNAQVTLSSNGPGNTYEDINAVLAPGNNVIEVPDCVHTAFGRHIDEVFDNELNTNVFRFIAHRTPDNDRCQNFDRQRIEIKTYSPSPDNLKAVIGETVEYKWKFKLPSSFQVSPNFTHLHQIKSVGGPLASIPMITLTARKGNPDRIELRYTPTNDQNTIQTADLSLFKGHWVEVNETITYGDNGSYSIVIKRISNGATLLNYNNASLDMWQDGADFARPKWGIYRSLNTISDLQDEEVLFNDFSIEEIQTLTNKELKEKLDSVRIIPNPSKNSITFKNIQKTDYDAIVLHNSLGAEVKVIKRLKNKKLDVSILSRGLYYIKLVKDKRVIKVLKCLIE